MSKNGVSRRQAKIEFPIISIIFFEANHGLKTVFARLSWQGKYFGFFRDQFVT
jgi:hypothetical protein